MEDLVDIISGVSYNKSDIRPSGIKILRGGNINNGKIVEFQDDVYIDRMYTNPQNTVKLGDIVLVASTGSATLIGKTGFAEKSYLDTQIGAFLRIIRPKSSLISKYLNIIFLSQAFKNYITETSKGTNINNVKNSYIESYIVPLPPLKEQERIVEKITHINDSINSILELSD